MALNKEQISERFKALQDYKQMNGPVSYAQMKQLVENSPAMKKMEETIAHMELMLERRSHQKKVLEVLV